MSRLPKTFAHFGNTGDVLASLPALRQFYRNTGVKPILCLIKDYPAIYMDGIVHPVTDGNGNHVGLNEAMINMTIPLLKCQDYLDDVVMLNSNDLKGDETDFDINLSRIRNTFCNIPFGDIRRWYFYIHPDLACNLAEQYIHVPDSNEDLAKGKIIITRSERYLNEQDNFTYLKEYEDDLLFIGTMREYNNFCLEYDLEIRKLHVDNFLELAQAIKQSNGHISNQTMAFQISEGMKHPRAVSLCSYAPNVIPCGENGYDFYSPESGEYYFHKMNDTLEKYMKKIIGSQN